MFVQDSAGLVCYPMKHLKQWLPGEDGPTIAAIFDVPATDDVAKWQCGLQMVAGDTFGYIEYEEQSFVSGEVVEDKSSYENEPRGDGELKRLVARWPKLKDFPNFIVGEPGHNHFLAFHFFYKGADEDWDWCFGLSGPTFKWLCWAYKPTTSNWKDQGM